MARDRVTDPGEDGPFGAELSLERVADRLEAEVMCSGEDELPEWRLAERVERDLRLPRPALDDECPRALLEVGRKRGGWVPYGSDRIEEPAQERLGIVLRPGLPIAASALREPVRGRIAEGDARRGRLADGQ